MDVVEGQRSSPPEDASLQLLQLQCIIDAKDREIQLLRKHLSSPEESEEAVILHSEIAQLRGEIRQLKLERNAQLAQPAPAPARSPGTAVPQGPSGEAPVVLQQCTAAVPGAGSHATAFAPHVGDVGQPTPAALQDSKSHPLSPSPGMDLNKTVLTEKLWTMVNGLVAEALTAHLRPVGQSPPAPFLPPSPPQQQPPAYPGAGAIALPYAGGYTESSPRGVASAWPQARAAWGKAEQHLTLAPAPLSLPPLPSDALPGAVRVAWPGVQIIVQPLSVLPAAYPTVPAVAVGERLGTPRDPIANGLGPWSAAAAAGVPPPPLECDLSGKMGCMGMRTTAEAVPAPSEAGGGRRTAPGAAAVAASAPVPVPVAAPAAAAMTGGGDDAGGGASAPAVLELNVDGSVVFVDRVVLESQAAGSRLHRTLVQEYGKLPRDSRGMPYLSYDPRVFQMLMSHLKERHLFGAAAASVGGPRDLTRTAASLGVSHQYLAQMAALFGLPDLWTALQPTEAAATSTSETSAFLAGSLAEQPSAPLGPVVYLRQQHSPSTFQKPLAHEPVDGSQSSQPAPPRSAPPPPEPCGAAAAVPPSQAGQPALAGCAAGAPSWCGPMGQPCYWLPSLRVCMQPQGSGDSGIPAGCDRGWLRLPDSAQTLVRTGSGGGDDHALQEVPICTADVRLAPLAAEVTSTARGLQPSTVTSSGGGDATGVGADSAERATGSSSLSRDSHANGISSMGSEVSGLLPSPYTRQPEPQQQQQQQQGSQQKEQQQALHRQLPTSSSSLHVLAPPSYKHVHAAAAPGTAAPDLAAAAAAVAATTERYRVPNLYEVLAKKQRAELES